jgi:hypothetical protein
MNQINDAYYRLEHGDIPTAQFDALTIEQRQKTGMKAIEQSARADENFKKTKQARGRRKNLVEKAVKALQSKKTDFNESEFDGFAATEYPDLVPLVSKLEEIATNVKDLSKSKKAINIASPNAENTFDNLRCFWPSYYPKNNKSWSRRAIHNG